jgi:uncharacterized protein (DUF1501 family)
MKSKYLAELQSRRQFFRRAACAAVGTLSMSNVLRDLRFINSAVAQTSITDYRALICVFLNGGNDANNMVIYTDPADYQSYAATRTSALALPNVDGTTATIQQLYVPGSGNTAKYTDSAGHTYGLHPAMSGSVGAVNLFNSGNLALLLNVGTLSYPINKAQYLSGSVPQPPQLYSHSDQQTQWQTSIPDQPPTSGWGGRMSDIMTAAQVNGSSPAISMAVTLAGSNIFEVGGNNLAPQYSISTSGAVQLSGSVTGNRSTTYNNILNSEAAFSDLQMKTYASVTESAITTAASLTSTLNTIGTPNYLTNHFPGFPNTVNITIPNGGGTYSSSLMAQMAMVCKMIDAGKNYLGMKRQIFFIQVGGYDTHTNQNLYTQTGNLVNSSGVSNLILGQQANLLAELSQTMGAFYAAMGDMGTLRGDGAAAMQKKAVAFTVSDFARTFPSNGSGSDHGWGSHHMIVGGDVAGGKTYGNMPVLAVNGPSDTGTGRWIPTTAVDQYAATLASWYGVDSSHLPIVFPNLGRFASSNLGFLPVYPG